MEHQEFDLLARRVQGRFFSSGKRETIYTSAGPFTPQQVYRLMGQFTSGDDRTTVLRDLSNSKRIVPMLAVDAEPIVKMGIYIGQKKSNLAIIAPHVVDRQNPAAREVLVRNFKDADRIWAIETLNQAGVYMGPPPPGLGTVIVATPPQYYVGPNPIISLVNNAATALFGGIFSASMPAGNHAGMTAVTTYHYRQQNAYPQSIYYPAAPNSQLQNIPPSSSQLPGYTQPEYPTQGYSDAPPAYSPASPTTENSPHTPSTTHPPTFEPEPPYPEKKSAH